MFAKIGSVGLGFVLEAALPIVGPLLALAIMLSIFVLQSREMQSGSKHPGLVGVSRVDVARPKCTPLQNCQSAAEELALLGPALSKGTVPISAITTVHASYRIDSGTRFESLGYGRYVWTWSGR
jgi:hypothetical protein